MPPSAPLRSIAVCDTPTPRGPHPADAGRRPRRAGALDGNGAEPDLAAALRGWVAGIEKIELRPATAFWKDVATCSTSSKPYMGKNITSTRASCTDTRMSGAQMPSTRTTAPTLPIARRPAAA